MASNNSALNEVRSLYLHIFADLEIMHPTIRTSLSRDLSRLRKAETDRGLPFYTITLPAGAKWLQKSLAAGRLEDPRPPYFGKRGPSDLRPSIFGCLFDEIFEPDGTLRACFEPSYIQSLRQVLLVMKKLDMECEERYTNECVSTFHEIERSLPKPWVETWNSDIPRWVSRVGHPIWGPTPELLGQTHMFDSTDSLLRLDEEFDWEGLRRFSARVLHSFGQFDPFAIKPKHGPGAISDREKGYVKYDFLNWSERLEAVFPYDFHASGTLSVPEYVKYKEYASVMHAVPKTQSGPRLIAAEPTAHQWIQQGIREWLETRCRQSLLAVAIDFRSQVPSRERALLASSDGESATVDLSSASDRLSCRLVEFLFQYNRPLLEGLHACRTRANVDIHGELSLLRKFATQGSAVIFPLQSICYAILSVWAVALTDGVKRFDDIVKLIPSVRTFGDDIVIPTRAYPVLKRLFETLLLKVNESKSYDTGKFRESCGMDAYDGIDVTPAYLRKFYSDTPESLPSIIEASNNFFKKGYWRTADYLVKTVPESERKLIPVGTGLGAVGMYSFCGTSVDHLHSRWNRDYHRVEYRVIDIDVRVDPKPGHGEGSLFQFFHEEPDPLLPYRSGQASTPRLRKKRRWVSTER